MILKVCIIIIIIVIILFTFIFIQSDLQMRTVEAIKTNKTAIKFKCYDKFRLAQRTTLSKFVCLFIYIYIYTHIGLYTHTHKENK